MEVQYDVCLTKLARCLTKTSIDTYQLKKIMTLYCGSEPENIPPELTSAKTTDGLFHEIRRHSSWFNYNLLELLIQLLNHQEGLELLLQYEKEHLHPYLDSISLVDIPAASFPSTIANSSYTRCVLVANLVGLTGKDAIIITRRLAEVLQMPSLQLLDCFENMHLIFGIHSEVFHNAIKREGSLLQKHLNKEEEVYRIKIDAAKLL